MIFVFTKKKFALITRVRYKRILLFSDKYIILLHLCAIVDCIKFTSNEKHKDVFYVCECVILPLQRRRVNIIMSNECVCVWFMSHAPTKTTTARTLAASLLIVHVRAQQSERTIWPMTIHNIQANEHTQL